MSTVSNPHAALFTHLLEASHWLSACSLAFLLFTLSDQVPEPRLLIGGAVFGIGMLLVAVWLCRTRSEPGWLLLLLFPLLHTALPPTSGAGLQLPAAMLASCTALMFLLRSWLIPLAKLD